jgi:transcription-repair coupling factor (superfamily II helicase)
MAVKVGLSEVVTMGGNLRAGPSALADSVQVRLQRMYPGSKYFSQNSMVTVPMPVINGEPLADADLIAWTSSFLVAIFGAELVETAPEVVPAAAEPPEVAPEADPAAEPPAA